MADALPFLQPDRDNLVATQLGLAKTGSSLTASQADIATAQGNISAAQGSISAAQGNISTLQGQVSPLVNGSYRTVLPSYLTSTSLTTSYTTTFIFNGINWSFFPFRATHPGSVVGLSMYVQSTGNAVVNAYAGAYKNSVLTTATVNGTALTANSNGYRAAFAKGTVPFAAGDDLWVGLGAPAGNPGSIGTAVCYLVLEHTP